LGLVFTGNIKWYMDEKNNNFIFIFILLSGCSKETVRIMDTVIRYNQLLKIHLTTPPGKQ